MKVFLKCSSVALSVATLGLLGCDGGGVEEGVPKDAVKSVSPEMQNQMQINMAPTKPSEIAKKKAQAEKATKALEQAK